MMYKKITLFVFSLMLSPVLVAQTVSVKQESARVKGENTDGYAVSLEAKDGEVSSAYIKFLKTYGKLKQTDGLYILTDALIYGANYAKPIYATVKLKDGTYTAWAGAKKEEWATPEEYDKIQKELEKLVYDFGVQFHRDKVQKQIDESNQALQAVEKQQQRLTTQAKDLALKLENNKKDKIQLEKDLENNKLAYETFLKKIDQNKKDQDSVAIAGEQIKKIVEMHKDRRQKIK